MKILHSADWHLGKKLSYCSRLPEQIAVLDELVQIADEEAVDLVLIAGDLFDYFTPATEAIDLLYKTLKRLSKEGKRPVIAIAGNHDSPSFIDAPNPLARACGIIMIGYPHAVVPMLDLPDFSITKTASGFLEIQCSHLPYPIRLLHTAFANEERLKTYLGEEKDKGLNEVLQQHWQENADLYCDEKGVNLLMTHLYMMPRGGALIEEPEGERPLKIGNADLVYTDAVPTQIQYTALGHLHGFRNIGTTQKPIVYASSPLIYSFSESGQQKLVPIISIEPGTEAQIKKVPLTAGKPLQSICFDDIDKAVEWLQENKNALVELTIESELYLSTNDRQRLYQAHDNIIFLVPKLKGEKWIEQTQDAKGIDLSQSTTDLFKAYFQSKNEGQEPNEEIMELFAEILQGNTNG